MSKKWFEISVKRIIIYHIKYFHQGKNMKKILAFCLIAMGAWMAVSQTLHAQETIVTDLKKKIKSVEVRGNTHVPTELIRPAIQSKVDDYYDEKAAQADIQRIVALGEVESVELQKQDVPGGLNLFYMVKELDRTVRAIRIKGNVKTRRDEVRACLLLNEGDKYNYRLVQEDIVRIHAMKYFESVRVTKKEIPGGLELTYEVAEHAEVADMPAKKKHGSVEFQSKPREAGVPYVYTNAAPAFAEDGGADSRGKVNFWSKKPDYYVDETYIGPERGPLMLSIGASHNFLGSK